METSVSPQPNSPSLPSAIVETCLHVTDLDASRAFYTRLFGYPVMASDHRFCAFNLGPAQVLLLFKRGSDPEGSHLSFGHIPPHASNGQSHIGFAVKPGDLPAWHKRLREQNIAIESEFTWPIGGTSVYFRDPDSHLLELLTPGVWPNY